MPKTSKSDETVPAPKPSTAVIRAAVARLDARYEVAQRLKNCKSHEEDALRRVAKGHVDALSYENLRKLLQLAEMVPTMTAWKKLRNLRLKSTGMPLTWTHLIALVSAENTEKLLKTARLAEANGWTEAQIRRHIQDESGISNRRPGSGRTMKAPSDLASGMRQLTDELRVVSKRIQLLQELAAADASQADLRNRLTTLGAALTKIISLEKNDRLQNR